MSFDLLFIRNNERLNSVLIPFEQGDVFRHKTR